MHFRYIKMLMVALAFVFATQGCAVYVRDHDHDRRHRYRQHHKHWRSSIEQPNHFAGQSAVPYSGNPVALD